MAAAAEREANGLSLHTAPVSDLWWSSDPGSTPSIVLLHEGAGSSQVWRSVQPTLSTSGRRVVMYDRRGFGRSPHDDVWTPAHFDAAVRDLVELLTGLSTQPVDLLGHSDGGSVALMVAARHPRLVRSAIVVATHVFADAVTVAALRGLGQPSEWAERIRDGYALQHGPDWERVVGGWLSMWINGTLADWDVREELGRIECPVLVVHDRRDPLSPAQHAEAIAAAVSGSTVRWYDHGSHRPHLADIRRFVAEARAFWAGDVAE